jgi:hypothetical protein
MSRVYTRRLWPHAAALAILAWLLGAPAEPTRAQPQAQPPDTIARGWPQPARNLVMLMLEKYGAPNLSGEDEFAWLNEGPWKRTIVSRIPQDQDAASTGKDYLEQTIDYRVPLRKVADLKRFDPRLQVDAANGELSHRSDSESLNRLAFNLAHEIVLGDKSPAQARGLYAEISELAAAGKASPYLESLIFKPGQAGLIYSHEPGDGYE